jgi:hypothetical protein
VKNQARKESRKKAVDDSRELMNTYETSSHRSLYCRVCAYQAESEEGFMVHRQSSEHTDKVSTERRLTACQLCRKQFTSAYQLKEHIKGKAHMVQSVLSTTACMRCVYKITRLHEILCTVCSAQPSWTTSFFFVLSDICPRLSSAHDIGTTGQGV